MGGPSRETLRELGLTLLPALVTEDSASRIATAVVGSGSGSVDINAPVNAFVSHAVLCLYKPTSEITIKDRAAMYQEYNGQTVPSQIIYNVLFIYQTMSPNPESGRRNSKEYLRRNKRNKSVTTRHFTRVAQLLGTSALTSRALELMIYDSSNQTGLVAQR